MSYLPLNSGADISNSPPLEILEVLLKPQCRGTESGQSENETERRLEREEKGGVLVLTRFISPSKQPWIVSRCSRAPGLGVEWKGRASLEA